MRGQIEIHELHKTVKSLQIVNDKFDSLLKDWTKWDELRRSEQGTLGQSYVRAQSNGDGTITHGERTNGGRDRSGRPRETGYQISQSGLKVNPQTRTGSFMDQHPHRAAADHVVVDVKSESGKPSLKVIANENPEKGEFQLGDKIHLQDENTYRSLSRNAPNGAEIVGISHSDGTVEGNVPNKQLSVLF